MNGWTDWRQKRYVWKVSGGVEQEQGEYKGDRERIDGDLKGALRNEQLFVGLVGVQRGCLMPPSP